MELLLDPCEPTRPAWEWVRRQLDLVDQSTAFVAARGGGYRDLGAEPELLARSMLVLDDRIACEHQVDVDEFGNELVFERDRSHWYLHYAAREMPTLTDPGHHRRTRWRTRSTLTINGCSLDSPHRLATGDRIESSYQRKLLYTRHIVAVI